MDINLIEKNPAHRIRTSKRDDTPDEDDDILEFLEIDELNRLLTYLEMTPHGKYKRSIQYLALFTLIARTDLRIGAALVLEWEDIDLDDGNVRVNKTLSFGSKLELKVRKPKTKKASRTLRIDFQTNEIMKYVVDCLGHADSKITMNIYLHFSNKIEHDEMELYEMRLNQTSPIQKSEESIK